MALLKENSDNTSSYSVVLDSYGTANVSVPYFTQIQSYNKSEPATTYVGSLSSGSNASLLIETTVNGGMIQQAYLSPQISISTNDADYNVLVRSYLSNGTLVASTGSDLIVNGTTYPMNAINSSSFETTLSYGYNGSSFQVYVSSPGILGGFAEAFLPQVHAVVSSIPPPSIIQAQVAVYTNYKGYTLLVSANDTISQMHSALYYETLLPQYGYFANGTWGYLGYYYGTFEAISGGQEGLTATVTVTYNGQSLTNETVSAAPGKTSYVDFTFGTASSGSSSSVVVLAPLALFISFPALAAVSVSINELWRRYQTRSNRFGEFCSSNTL